jgi:hypothetical protein
LVHSNLFDAEDNCNGKFSVSHNGGVNIYNVPVRLGVMRAGAGHPHPAPRRTSGCRCTTRAGGMKNFGVVYMSKAGRALAVGRPRIGFR